MPKPEKSTVVAVLDDFSSAQSAARDLESEGIPRDDIKIKSNLATGAAGRGTVVEHQQSRGFFSSLGGFFGGSEKPAEEESHFNEAVRRGNALLAVTCDRDNLDKAVKILNQHGAVDIDTRVEAFRQTGYTQYDPKAPAYTADEAARERERFREGRTTIPVVEEQVQVGTRAIRRGGVRIYSRTVEEPVHEQVKLREEHAVVERRPVNRPVEPGDEAAMRDQTIEVTEMHEEPVIAKSARVKEEIVIGKETRERTEDVNEKVRHTEVEVKPIEGQGSVMEGVTSKRGGKTVTGRDVTEPMATGRSAAGAGTSDLAEYRRDYDQYYASSGIKFDDMRPVYEFGREKAADPRYRGKSWAEVEPELRREFAKTHSSSKWEDIKDSVMRSWERVKH